MPLMRQFPESAVWSHPVFQHEDHGPYAHRVAALIEECEQPSQLAVLTQALPVLTAYLKTAEAWNEAQIAELSAALTAEIRTAEERQAGTYQSSLRGLLAGSVFQLQPPLALASILTPVPTPAVIPATAPAPASPSASCSGH